MDARLAALENRPRKTERALVLERLARQTAEVAQQTVGTWPAGVDAEEIGTLPMFSGDVDSSEQAYSVPWSQWSLTIQSYFGKFNRTTAWMLQQLETSVDDPICSDLQGQSAAGGPTSSQKFRVRGMETAVRGVRATSPGKVARNVPSPLVASGQMSRCRWSVSKRAD